MIHTNILLWKPVLTFVALELVLESFVTALASSTGSG